jgi:patatin-related protein
MSASNEVRPERELRLAVVMYGGVSLAVYMNGVAQELLNLVRATAPDLKDPTCCAALYSDDKIRESSTEIYREIARLPLKDDSAPTSAAIGPIRQRVVIDILTGTSAGGINAIFLAKALANEQSLDDIASLWETEADIDKLINDRHSRKKMPKLPRTVSPRSLLNSRRMYAKLLEAFNKMGQESAKTSHPLVDELDLFVTATDLEGLPVYLQLGGGEIAEERRHRKAFRLRFGRSAGRNDFTKADNPFLAFIARCTSSFPFAFEPMQFSQAMEGKLDTKRWARHFSEYSASESQDQIAEREIARPYGDGGYLDNKPFGYAIDTIAARSGGATARVERKLVFIDPDPERALDKRSSDSKPPVVPNAVENALIALRLPAYETIREDLLRLGDRNRIVGKIQNVVRGLTGDFTRLDPKQRKRLAKVFNQREKFRTRDLDDIVKLFGAPYGGYHRLKVSNLTDEIAELVANRLRISLDSDEFRLVRAEVRAWRDAVYSPNPVERSRLSKAEKKATEFEFMQDMDCSYRVRRLAFVIEQINRISGADALELNETLGASHAFGLDPIVLQDHQRIAELLTALNDRRRKLAATLRTLRDGREALFGRAEQTPQTGFTKEDEDSIRKYLAKLMKDEVGGGRARRGTAEKTLQPNNAVEMRVLSELKDKIVIEVGRLAECASAACAGVVPEIKRADAEVPTSSDLSKVADNIVRHYYAWYELYDEMIFPISHGSEVGEEVAMVEPVRISPLSGCAAAGGGSNDARLLPAGIELGHFGAFLNVDWRANDILLGRLNAAEKLIGMMLTGVPQPDADAKKDFVRRAQTAIIGEERKRVDSRTKEWMDDIPNADSSEKVLKHIKDYGMPRTEVDRKRSLVWVTRSVKVTGKVLDAAAKGKAATRVANAFTLAAQVLAAVAEVAVPQNWWGLQLRRWLVRLWLYAVGLVVLGMIVAKDEMVSLGFTVTGVVTGVGLLAVLLRGWVLRKTWLRLFILGMFLLTACLAVIGGVYLWSIRASLLP